MCGAANKLESVFCLNCGARLVPLTAASAPEKPQPAASPIKGLSLPARESPGELPAELQQLEAELAEPEEKETATLIDPLRAAPIAEEGAPPAEAEEVPDWLRAVQPGTPSQPAEAKVEAGMEPAAAMPSWLQKLRPVTVPEESAETTDVAVDQVPDWLTAAASTKQEPASKEPQPEASAETSEIPAEEMPDWLTTAASTKQEPATKEPEPEAPKTEAPLKAELLTPVAELPTPIVEEPVATPVAKEEIPAWLLELKPKAAEPQGAAVVEPVKSAEPLLESLESQIPSDLTTEVPASVLSTQPSFSTISDDDIPDWLKTAPSVPVLNIEPIEVSAGIEAPSTIQAALPEEVPDWLASLKPKEQLIEDDTVESSGPLAGLRGVLPLALAVAEPHPPRKLTPTVVPGDSGNLFESILAVPRFAGTAPAAVSKRRGLTMRPLIYLMMALAVLIPFFIPSDLANSSIDISSPLVTSFYDTVQALPANSTVVVSFDYDPSQSSEMDLQAKAIVQHLIKRRVKIIAMSTLATGAPIAQKILDAAAGSATSYVYGTNYLNLGYRAGYEAGLSQLATGGFQANAKDFSQNQALSTFTAFTNVKTLRDVAVVIELAGSEDPLKMWMEQVQPSAGVKIIAGVSASVEPKARAYHDTPNHQLAAVVSGLIGAAQYEVLTNQAGLALTSLNAQSVAQLTLVLIIVLGNIVFWISRRQRWNV
jgi:hypothetical protein